MMDLESNCKKIVREFYIWRDIYYPNRPLGHSFKRFLAETPAYARYLKPYPVQYILNLIQQHKPPWKRTKTKLSRGIC